MTSVFYLIDWQQLWSALRYRGTSPGINCVWRTTASSFITYKYKKNWIKDASIRFSVIPTRGLRKTLTRAIYWSIRSTIIFRSPSVPANFVVAAKSLGFMRVLTVGAGFRDWYRVVPDAACVVLEATGVHTGGLVCKALTETTATEPVRFRLWQDDSR